jgi:aspartyl-tRNA(Asn)/glutamyl-tRNA(Gln) amidotransferase subunit A
MFSALQGREAARTPESPPRLGRLKGPFHDAADRTMRTAIDDAAAALEQAGAEILDVSLPFDFDEVIRNHRTIMSAEAAETHGARFAEFPNEYQPKIRALIEEGQDVPAARYPQATDHQDALRALLRSRPRQVDALMMPATLGVAPDATTTGDPLFNSPWSYCGVPSVSLPIGLSPDGLPLAMQLVETQLERELELLTTALWCEDVLRRSYRSRD